MTVRLTEAGVILLEGNCPSQDAEALLSHLAADRTAQVDWRACESAHTAVIQVLIAARIAPRGPPADGFLAEMVSPLFKVEAKVESP